MKETRSRRGGGILMSFNLAQVQTSIQSQAIRYLDSMMTLKMLTKKVAMMVLIMLLALLSVQIVFMVSPG